jgi:hypothetical protein
MRTRELEVTPVVSYPEPAYPSHRDPRPDLDEPALPSLPRELARAIAAAMIGVSLPLSALGAGTAPPAANPFALATSGFPIHPIRYGTGQPSRLTEEEARPLIRRVLGAAGLKLAEEVDPRLPGIRVRLDGWDAQKKIGYEFVNWDDYEYAGGHVRTDPAKGLSFDELKKLEALSSARKAQVAVISYRRYPYGRNAAAPDDVGYRALLKRSEQAKDPATQQQLRAELAKLGHQLALKALERDLHAYLDWLRAQGAL